MRKRILVLAALLSAVGADSISTTATAKAPPVHLTFSKQASGPGVWSGAVAGDIEGALTTRLISIDDHKPVNRVTFDWIVDAKVREPYRLPFAGRILEDSCAFLTLHRQQRVLSSATHYGLNIVVDEQAIELCSFRR